MATAPDPTRFPGLARRQDTQLQGYLDAAQAAKGAKYGSLAWARDPNRYGTLASTKFPELFGPGLQRREQQAAPDAQRMLPAPTPTPPMGMQAPDPNTPQPLRRRRAEQDGLLNYDFTLGDP